MTFDHEAYDELFHKDDQTGTQPVVQHQKKPAQETDAAVETDEDTSEEYKGAGDPPEETDQDDTGGDE